jgi:putative OPT family oligopeptide transporter
MEHAAGKKVLPDNAYRVLNPGESYVPIVPAAKSIIEISPRVFAYGIALNIIFTFAAAYLGLLTGNVIEAAIPIAILAVFMGKTVHRRPNTIAENVMIQSIGAGSGVVVAGVVFTLPALYINKLSPNMLHIIISSSLGGFLGIVLLIPLRRYFVAEMHGHLPFPEATATTEIIVQGESHGASKSGLILIISTGIGALFDFLTQTVRLWNASLSSSTLLGKSGVAMAKKHITLKLDALAALFGLGVIIGLRYAAVIAAGSLLSFLVLIPMVYYIGAHTDVIIPHAPLSGGAKMLIRDMDTFTLFKAYVQPIGIGTIAVAGLISILKMSRIIIGSFSLGFKALAGDKNAHLNVERTDRDVDPKMVLLAEGVLILALGLFYFFLVKNISQALVAMAVTFVFAFLFTAVAARAIAIVGTNPVSGMTLITLIVSSIILMAAGLKGDPGQYLALVIGAAVCTALSTAGGFITDLKIGYWVGVTPRTQQTFKFIGIIVASLSVGVAMWLLASSYGFEKTATTPNPLAAPQGKLMATIMKSLMSGESLPYLLYGLGGAMALILEMSKVPALAFGLGMYLPLEINLGVLVGGFVAWLIGRSGKTDRIRTARQGQGILIASGMMAGAALIGILSAVLQLQTLGVPARYLSVGAKYIAAGGQWLPEEATWFTGGRGQVIGLVMFIVLGVIAYQLARKGAQWQIEEEDGPSGDGGPSADEAPQATVVAESPAEEAPAEEKPEE